MYKADAQKKAQLIEFVTKNSIGAKNVFTLAIGDGNNDVNMIKTANVGVGIKRKDESGHAASTADI